MALACVLAASAYVLLQGGSEPSLTNTHARALGEPTLTSVPGYAYENPTGEFLSLSQDLEQAFREANDQSAKMLAPGTGYFYVAMSGHQVMSGADQPDALLFLAEVNPAVEGMPGYEPEQMLMAMAGQEAAAGGTVTTEAIGGEEVVTVEVDGGTVYGWYHDGTMSFALGPDESAVRDFTEDYLAQVNG